MITTADMQVVIPSRRRVESCARTMKLFNDPIVCVAEEEYDDYVTGLPPGSRVETHPNDIHGLGRLRQWILDFHKERVLVQCNDDVHGLLCMVGLRTRKITDPRAIEQILLNSANIADGIGAPCFSFNATRDIRKTNPQTPFQFNRIEGSFFGMIDRPVRYDPRISNFDDVDLSFECLLKKRIVFADLRFAPDHNFQTMSGGNSVSRGTDKYAQELAIMKGKWGDLLGIGYCESTIRLSVTVQRKQTLTD